MAEHASFVAEYSNSTGTGDITLDVGAVTAHRRLRDVWTASQTWVGYYLLDADGENWERGYGRFTYSLNRLERDYVMESTNSDSAIDLSAGKHTVRISPNPDTAQRRGFCTGYPTTAGSLVPLVVPSDTLKIITFDTDPMEWDSEGDYSASSVSQFDTPSWCTKLRISCQIVWPDNTTGNRLLMVKQYDSGGDMTLPASNIAGGTKITTNAWDKGHHQHLCSGLLDIADLGGGFTIHCAQDSGGDLTLVEWGWVMCEFVE